MVAGFFENLYKDDSVIGTYSLTLEENWGLNDQERIMLSKEVSIVEVKMTLFTMNPNKSPGVDGYHAIYLFIFYFFPKSLECGWKGFSTLCY